MNGKISCRSYVCISVHLTALYNGYVVASSGGMAILLLEVDMDKEYLERRQWMLTLLCEGIRARYPDMNHGASTNIALLHLGHFEEALINMWEAGVDVQMGG